MGSTSSSEKAAIALIQTLEPVFKSGPPNEALFKALNWDQDLVQAVVLILRTHPVGGCFVFVGVQRDAATDIS